MIELEELILLLWTLLLISSMSKTACDANGLICCTEILLLRCHFSTRLKHDLVTDIAECLTLRLSLRLISIYLPTATKLYSVGWEGSKKLRHRN